MAFDELNRQILDEVHQQMTASTAQASGSGTRFVIELSTEMTPETAREAVAGALNLSSEMGIQIEPLFNAVNPDFGMHRFFVLTLAISPTNQSGMFDVAYALRDTCGFVAVDPDVLDSVYFLTPAVLSDQTRPQLEENDPPEDAPPPNWSLKNIRADRAWAMTPPPGGAPRGKGIVIAHTDTGWAEHPDVDMDDFDLVHAKNILNGSNDARNPLNPELERVLYPGHGTATASVAVTLFPGKNSPPKPRPEPPQGLVGVLLSIIHVLVNLWEAVTSAFGIGQEAALQAQTTAEADVPPSGVAPDATLIPIRYSDTVVVTSGLNLARAIHYAAEQEADIILITSGGITTPWLEAAVTDAVQRSNCIVVASAGNAIPFVAAPAFYEDCIAVAGTNVQDAPWDLSAHGPAVNISAPAEMVWRATFDPKDNMAPRFWPGSGTSFSAPNMAGVVALWLAYHGREALRQRYQGKATLTQVLLRLLADTRRLPLSWDADLIANYGGGIVDAAALLAAPLPDADSFAGETSEWKPQSHAQVIHMMTQELPAEVRPAEDTTLAAQTQQVLETVLGQPAAEFDDLAAAYGGELMRLLYARHAPKQGVAVQGVIAPALSRRLQAALKGNSSTIETEENTQ
ncbi:MAG: S8/S53 family peptidase [Anaerolineaceae bacterium]|nr:S8/S53 family peptidase [Anaerolineaceae bacterium]